MGRKTERKNKKEEPNSGEVATSGEGGCVQPCSEKTDWRFFLGALSLPFHHPFSAAWPGRAARTPPLSRGDEGGVCSGDRGAELIYIRNGGEEKENKRKLIV